MNNTEKQQVKNKAISDAIKRTKEKRQSQYCKVFKFKVHKDSLTKQQKEHLKMLFNEAKWVYNYLLAQMKDENYHLDCYTYKELKSITKFDKDKNVVPINITHLGTSMMQSIIDQIKISLKSLKALKSAGYNIGALRFKSEYNCIPLKQYNNTHKIEGSKIKIQGLKSPIRVRGLKQLSKFEDLEYANANLLFDGIDYYIALTTYIDRDKVPTHKPTNKEIGIDFGCINALTLSDSTKIDISIKESERLKRLQRKLERQVKGSNNRNKTKLAIRKEYNHINNKKNDIANKVVHKLLTDFDLIVAQDDQLNEWKNSDYKNEKIQHSIIGRIKSRLKRSPRVVFLDQWFPTSKQCIKCGHKVDSLEVQDRTFKCPNCGLEADRDVHAATNMLYYYNTIKDTLGTSDTSKPVSISYRAFKALMAKQEDTTI